MKFLCSTEDLLTGLQLVSRAISKQQTLPILGNVLLHVEGKRCTLSGTNLELSIVTSFPAQIENEGSVTVPMKAILHFVQFNQDPEILLETTEGTHLKLKSKKARAVISGEAASEYPTITPIDRQISFSLPGKPLLDALNMVTFACAKTTSRPVLSGVFVRLERGQLILVATDSYRLSEYKLPVEGLSGDISCIIPARFLEELRAVLGGRVSDDAETNSDDDDGKKKMKRAPASSVEIGLSTQQIEVRTGSTQFLSRLIDGKFPNYEQILPKEKKTVVHIKAGELLTDIKRMHYFAREMNNNITFSIEGSVLKLSTQETQIGKDESEIEAKVDGESNKIALSSSYLIDFLTHISGSDLSIELSDKSRPAVFRTADATEFLHLIMPLRMNEE